nr:MAG TPA: hypothetical protein [Caudoviricetes sp.]
MRSRCGVMAAAQNLSLTSKAGRRPFKERNDENKKNI